LLEFFQKAYNDQWINLDDEDLEAAPKRGKKAKVTKPPKEKDVALIV
jgi:hypothetical protein